MMEQATAISQHNYSKSIGTKRAWVTNPKIFKQPGKVRTITTPTPDKYSKCTDHDTFP
jgi:hypothetical protein